MQDLNRILVVSRSTKYCRKAVHYGISLARKYKAELFIIHVIHNPFSLEGWNLPVPSLEEEYERLVQTARDDIDKLLMAELQTARDDIGRMIKAEQSQGLAIKEVIKEGDPVDEVLRMVRDEKIDLLVMLAHEEGRIEHFLFGRANEELVRRMPCHIMLVKKEPGRVD
jgi:nucleotide-binding universal stress UspA family protein